MLDALIDRLYGAFDKSPDAAVALTLPKDETSWIVADRQLTVTSGAAAATVALDGVSIADVAGTLTAAGIPAIASIPMSSVAATVLLDGAGSAVNTVTGHRSVLWAILSAYATELRYAKGQVPEAIKQAYLDTAQGEWLDLWGSYFGCPRWADMGDADYLQLIVDTILLKKTNGIAIENAVLRFTGDTVTIVEPWMWMFRLDKSKLSGTDHFHDGVYYTYNVIQPVATSSIDAPAVMRVINQTRPAGTIAIAPRYALPAVDVSVPIAGQAIDDVRTDLTSTAIFRGGNAPLGLMRLDNNGIVLNYPSVTFEVRSFTNVAGAQGIQDEFGRTNIARAAVVLSAGSPLGAQNAIFSRGVAHAEFSVSPSLSGLLSLSGYSIDTRPIRVQEITTSSHAISTDGIVIGVLSGGEVRHISSAGAYDAAIPWTGAWNSRMWVTWPDCSSVMSIWS